MLLTDYNIKSSLLKLYDSLNEKIKNIDTITSSNNISKYEEILNINKKLIR